MLIALTSMSTTSTLQIRWYDTMVSFAIGPLHVNINDVPKAIAAKSSGALSSTATLKNQR